MGIQELISIMGYRKDSPFKNNPYNDIYTENGTIDMSNTDQDLWGIDEFGTKKRMKAGRKNPYKFEGQVVREIPIGQLGGSARDLANSMRNSSDSPKPEFFDKKKIAQEEFLKTLLKNQTAVSQAKETPIYQQKINNRKKEYYAATQPNAELVNGELRRINQNVSMEGVPNAGSPEERQAKGLDHMINALVIADGVGPIGKGAYTFGKKGYEIIKNKLRNLSTKANSLVGDFGRMTREFNPSYMKKVLSQVDEGNAWTKEWYSNPITKERYDNFVAKGNPFINPKRAQEDAFFNSVIPGINLDKNLALKRSATVARNNYDLLLNEGKLTQATKQKLNNEGTWAGVYKNHTSNAYVDILNPSFKKDFNVSNTVVHENIHALTNGEHGLLPEARNALKAPFRSSDSEFLNNTSHYDKYLKNPTEIHARIGELRKTFKLKPEDQLNIEDINHIINEGLAGKTSVDSRWFQLIKDKNQFKWLMNNAPVIVPATLGATAMTNKYQKGGFTKQDIYNYLFEDDEEIDTEVQAQEQIQQVDNKPDLHQETAIKNMVFEKRIADSRESGTPKISGNKGQYAFNYLQQKHGLPAHVAAGIVGNFIQESGNFRDDVISGQKTGDSGKARGIAQWHPDRWNPLVNSAKEQGRNPYTLDFQLDYAIQEAKQRGDLNKVMNTKTSEEAANTFAKWYERPKVIDKNRAMYAKKYHPYKYGGMYEEILNII